MAIAKLRRPPASNGKPVTKANVYVATPCYGGQAFAPYIMGLLYSCLSMQASGVSFKVQLYANESLITRARNKIMHDFLLTDCSHLFFVDADVGFTPKDFGTLVMSDFDVVCGAYPMKAIGWANVVQAVKDGKSEGHLQDHAGLYAVNPAYADAHGSIDVKEVHGSRYVEVLDGATGFMVIKRTVIEKMIAHYADELAYTTDYPPVGETHIAIFETMVDPVSKRYLSEDYAFCRRWQAMGGKVHVCIDLALTHTGMYRFEGCPARLFEESPADARPVAATEGYSGVSQGNGGLAQMSRPLPAHTKGDDGPDDGLPVRMVLPA